MLVVLVFLLFAFLLSLSLASAICVWFASVAPVRGSTYFSLPRQRKVGKRKPLNTIHYGPCLRAPS
ncbi:hypothetical protein, partial [Paraburkholderia sp. C35]|uniref:hypothetical protein n=1 Tax=Paraburkholderia sp. C35 TaxID=2126993 RepID=UPI001951EEB7